MPANRRKTSFVWDYFRVCDDDIRKAVCNNCGALIVRGRDTRSFSTSSLASHIKYCHRSPDKQDSVKRVKRKRPPSTDIDILLLSGERLEQDANKGSDDPDHKEDHEQVVQDIPPTRERFETYVLPDDKQEAFPDVICSKRMDLVHSGHLLHVLYQQHKCGKFCDLTLISAPTMYPSSTISQTDSLLTSGEGNKKEIYQAHSSVLAAMSTKIRTLIEMGSRTIELKDVSPFGLNSLLEITYTGKLKRKSPLRFFEAHQIWKAASDLGVKYVHDYLANEHPQVAKWIADEEKQQATGEKNFVYEITEENNDLVDLCGTAPTSTETEEYGEEIDPGQESVTEKADNYEEDYNAPQESEQDPVNAEVKTEDSSLLEITFSKA